MENFFKSWKEFLRFKKIKNTEREYVFYAETISDWSYLDPIIYELSKKKKL